MEKGFCIILIISAIALIVIGEIKKWPGSHRAEVERNRIYLEKLIGSRAPVVTNPDDANNKYGGEA